MGGGGGINFWNVCKTQHFQFHPDLGGGIFLGCEYKTQHFQFYPNIHAKHFGGGNIFIASKLPNSHIRSSSHDRSPICLLLQLEA